MNKRHLLGLVAALPLAWLTACGGGDNGNDANVRLVNASAYSSLDLNVDDADSPQITAVAFGTGSAYAGVPSGDVDNVLTQTGSGTELLTQTRSLGSGKKYTIVAFGWEGALRSAILTDDENAADSGKTKVNVLNEAMDAGELDVYLTGTDDSLDSSTPVASGVDGGSSSGFNSVTSGTYRLRVTAAGDTTDVRLDVPAVTLDSTKVVNLVLTTGSGGVLVNAMGLVQDGDVTPYLNTQGRVRVVAAMANSGTVTVTAGGTPLASNAKSSTVLAYQTIDAGTLTLSTTVNGTALSAGTLTLTGGEDVTVLVTGTTAADAVVSQIVDDNRLPLITTKYKIRMIHAAPTLADQNLSMTIDFGAVVDDLAFAHASDWTSLPASTSSTIDVTSPADGSVFTLTDLTLLSKGLYTLFMFDTTNGLVGVLRKDR
ncbi:DUF4397 domain-containing protein [Ideonella sp. YS5]|uniref:DUF4397 domain-containing protein n=1 Tax=Ideonella sp. YS5 TaxID=3453714 RepID=UPI003EEB5768